MKQGLLSWSPCPLFPSLPSPSAPRPHSLKPIFCSVTSTLESVNEEGQEKLLTARERRQMRNERRESRPAYNWKEKVEERLIKKPKKRYVSWTEELNLDNLGLLGPQWWVVRVSRVSGQETAERMARLLARNFPDVDFKVYVPSIQVKRKLKNGSLSVKPKPLFPGCVFLRCVMNKELHDFIRDCDGVGGFVGSKVGNTKRQINKPRPVDAEDMEAIFKQAKEEQEKADQTFEAEQSEAAVDPAKPILDSPLVPEAVTRPNKPKSRSKKAVQAPPVGKNNTSLKPGSTVQVLSGAFAGFSGTLKKVDNKTQLATVGFTLFGKETLADIDVNEVLAQTDG